MSLSMRRINARSGKPRILFRHMLMDASMSTDASSHMVGKNKSITHTTTRCMHAGSRMSARNRTVPTSTRIRTGDSR
jgi:hypothetical protein